MDQGEVAGVRVSQVNMRICDKEIRVSGRLIRMASLDAEGYQFFGDPEEALAALGKSDERIDLLTFIQRLSDPKPRYAYHVEWDNMAVLPVTTFEHWWKEQIGFKARNKAKQAEKKGVAIREVPFDDALVQGIQSIYSESPLRQGKRFWHYGEDLETIRRTKAAYLDRSVFIGAFFEGQLIGFIKLVWDETQTQAGLMDIISMVGHRDKAPTNALVAQAVRSCAERSIPHLWYANFAYGKKQRSTLSDFKERNGFGRVDVPRYYVPLTPLGRVALHLGVHHNWADWIPEPVAAGFRRVRNRWYARKFPGFEKALNSEQ